MAWIAPVRLAILLPHATAEWVARARALIRLLNAAALETRREIHLAIGIPQVKEANWRAFERAVAGPNVVARHLVWQPVDTEHVRRMFTMLDPDLIIDGIPVVHVPRDWGWNFSDCDAWINFADPALGALLPLRPTLHFCMDLAVRIVPDAYGTDLADPYWTAQTDCFRLWRQALVATSDPHTREDLVGYAGVRRERTLLLPHLIDGDEVEGAACLPGIKPEPLVWLADLSPVHDVEAVLSGLHLYRREGGTILPVLVSARLPDLAATPPSAASLPDHLQEVLVEIPRAELTSEMVLTRLIGRAKVTWSSRVAGGDAEAMRRAAAAGSRFLGADYPLHRDEAARVGIEPILYPPGDAVAIADALHRLDAVAGEPVAVIPLIDPAAHALRIQQISFLLEQIAVAIRG